MKRPDDSVLFGIRKGVAIYFNNVIEKDRIKEIVCMLVDMTGVTFTGKQAQGEPKIRLVRGGWERVFDNTFKSSTFESSNVLMFTDGTKDTLQTTQIYMNLWNPCRSASCILVDCMMDIDWKAIINFIQTINKMLHLQYVSAGYNVVWNDFWYPGSAAYSLKFLQTLKYANSKWTEWFYLGFAVNKGICGPIAIIRTPGKSSWVAITHGGVAVFGGCQTACILRLALRDFSSPPFCHEF